MGVGANPLGLPLNIPPGSTPPISTHLGAFIIRGGVLTSAELQNFAQEVEVKGWSQVAELCWKPEWRAGN